MSVKVINHPTLEQVKVNEGAVRPIEKPLWVGDSAVTINGKRVRISVTSQNNWFWVRFALQGGMLPGDAHKKLIASGWGFSKKKRLAYWHESSEAVVKFLRGLGYSECQHIEIETPVPVDLVRQDVELLPDSHVVNGKVARTAKFVKNKGGMWMHADTGKLAKHAEVLEWFTAEGVAHEDAPQEKPLPTELPKGDDVVILTEDDDVTFGGDDEGDEDDSIEYRQGFEDAAYEADDCGAIGLYDRASIAKYLGMTVDELSKRVGNDYIQGFLDGFESVRPKPKVMGLRARLGLKPKTE